MRRTFSTQGLLTALALMAAVLMGLSGICANAQTAGAGTITGTVTDASQAVVPNAKVVVTNADTGVDHQYQTNAAGNYTAPFLVPGHYKVAATSGNFGTVTLTDLTLFVGQTLTANVTLKVQSANSTVEVSASNQILDPDKVEVSQVIDSQFVANLPVNTRNWSSFALMTPNVTQDGSSGLISFHGISGLYNQNYVDGANNNQMLFSEARGRASGMPYSYSVDSIKEFQSETANYSVEFGQAAGGQVNAITRGGSNGIHGDLFYFLRYPSLNALDPYTKYQALHVTTLPTVAAFQLTPPTHQQQQFGGSVGGPIVKDKLFYFFTYDGYRRVGKALYYNTNYISTAATLPAGTSSSTSIWAGACPATITATQCQTGINFLNNQTNAVPSRFAKEDLFFPRIDYHLNAKNDVFLDYDFANFQSTYGYTSGNTISNSSPSTNAPTFYHERFLVGGWTMQIGNSSVNNFHGQWSRDLETAGANASGPSVGMGAVTYGMPNALPRIAEPDEHRMQLSDVFSTVHGRHTLKFGGDFNLVHEVMINLFQGGGIYSYGESTNTANFQDWISDAFAGQAGNTDPLAGYHYQRLVQTIDQVNTAAGTQGKDDFWMKMYDVFAEDSWKVNTKLTVNAGVRYDIQLTPNPGLVNHLFDPISSQYTSTIKNVVDRVQPRVGFAWAPIQGTVVRGGYGLFSALNQGSTYYAMRVENGVVQLNYTYSGCFGVTNCSTVGKLRYPNLPVTPAGPSLSGAVYPTGGAAPAVTPISVTPSYSFHGLDPNFVPPLAHEWNLGVEQLLPGKFTLQLGYVGTRGMRLPVFLDANLIGQKPHGAASYAVQDATNKVTQVITAPVYLPTDRRNQALSSFNTGFSVANTWYNGMAVTVRRSMANGLQVLFNYTWAKATDTGQVQGANGTFYGGDVPTDPNHIQFDNGPSDIDIRNRAVLTFVYGPTFKVDGLLLRNLANGWQISGTEIASGGEPIFLGITGTIYSGNTTPSSYADESGIFGGAMSSSTGSATSGRPPQIGRNSIYGPGYNDFDMRLTKNVPIHEGIAMQFNAEAFNLLNRQIITGVVTSYSTFVAPGKSATGSSYSCATTAAAPASGGVFAGCFVPYTGTGVSAFGQPSSTSGSTLYGSRQLQVSAKLTF